LTIAQELETGWHHSEASGSDVVWVRAALVRLLWGAIHPQRAFAGMPEGWFRGRLGPVATVPFADPSVGVLRDTENRLRELLMGNADPFVEWAQDCTIGRTHPFEVAVRDADLELVSEFAKRLRLRRR
jgi:hypothetical protein